MSNMPAVRAFRRIMAPHYRAEAEAAYYDAQFDGGEWSASAHDRMFEDLEQTIAEKVAARFGITRRDLFDALCHAENESHHHFFHFGE